MSRDPVLRAAPPGSQLLRIIDEPAKYDAVLKTLGNNNVTATWRVPTAGSATLQYYVEQLRRLGWHATNLQCYPAGRYVVVAAKNIGSVWTLATLAFTSQPRGGLMAIQLRAPAAASGSGSAPVKSLSDVAACPQA